MHNMAYLNRHLSMRLSCVIGLAHVEDAHAAAVKHRSMTNAPQLAAQMAMQGCQLHLLMYALGSAPSRLYRGAAGHLGGSFRQGEAWAASPQAPDNLVRHVSGTTASSPAMRASTLTGRSGRNQCAPAGWPEGAAAWPG